VSEYVYRAVVMTDDGSETVIDLETPGWAKKDFLARTVRWTLVPRDGAKTIQGAAYPIVTVSIPMRAKPVFKTRVYGRIGGPQFRCYAIGYKLGRTVHLTWILPTGDIETTTHDDVLFADLLLRTL
jgi:hypothetical protein